MSFTQLPDYVIDECRLSPMELSCFVVISRKTIGWGKRTDGISYSQFMELIDASKNTIIKALRSLEEKGLIVIESSVKANGAFSYNRYSFSEFVINKANEVHIPDCQENNQEVVQQVNKGGSAGEQGVVQQVNIQDKPNTKQTRQPPKEKKPKAMDDEINGKIVDHIIEKLRKDNPNLKANVTSWSEDIRKMRAIDKLDAREIVRVFNWANADSFWSTNIRSPQKLRKHFDTLTAKKEAERINANTKHRQPYTSSPTVRNEQAMYQWADEQQGF